MTDIPFPRRHRTPRPDLRTHYAFEGVGEVFADPSTFPSSTLGTRVYNIHNVLQIVGLTGGMVAEAVTP